MELEKQEDSRDAFLSIIKHSTIITDKLYARYQAILDNDEEFTPDLLYQWRDYLLAYEQLDEILKLARKDATILTGGSASLLTLAETVSKKNELRDLFKTEGKHLIAKWLTPYYNRFRTEFKE